MQHYLVLQGNLVALASELDNYPTEETDAFAGLDIFPDQIMRKDCLHELLPFEERSLPRPPIIPPCTECMANNLSGRECRVQLQHVAPSGQLSDVENQELLRAVQVLLARQRQHSRQDREKRVYKRWGDHEKYTLCLAISKFGILSTAKIAQVFPNRSEKQVKNFIFKSLKDEAAIPSMDELIRNPPPGYVPPQQLAYLFQASSQHADPVLKPSRNDFGSLVGLAMGMSLLEADEVEPSKPAPQVTAPPVVQVSPLPPAVPPMQFYDVFPKDGEAAIKQLAMRAQGAERKEQAALLLEHYAMFGQMSRGVRSSIRGGREQSKAEAAAANCKPAAPLLPPPVTVPARVPPFARHGYRRLQEQQGGIPAMSADVSSGAATGMQQPTQGRTVLSVAQTPSSSSSSSASQSAHQPASSGAGGTAPAALAVSKPKVRRTKPKESKPADIIPIPSVPSSASLPADEQAAPPATAAEPKKAARKKKVPAEDNGDAPAAKETNRKKRGAQQAKKAADDDAKAISKMSSSIFSPVGVRGARRVQPSERSLLQVVRSNSLLDEESMDGFFGQDDLVHGDALLIDDIGEGLSFF